MKNTRPGFWILVGLLSAGLSGYSAEIPAPSVCGWQSIARAIPAAAGLSGTNPPAAVVKTRRAQIAPQVQGLPAYSSWVRTYYPANEGDSKSLRGTIFGQDVSETYSVSDLSDSGFRQDIEVNGDVASIDMAYSGTSLVWNSMSESGYDLSFDPPLVFLNDAILSKGGTVRTTSTTYVSGIPVALHFSSTVTLAGTVSVPAGTYYDCRSITISLSASANGRTTRVSAQAFILAPGIGQIREHIYSSSTFSPVGWVNLTDGTVGGQNVSDIILESVAPKITIKTPPNNSRTTNSTVLMSGLASDNHSVAAVYWQQGQGPWQSAEGATNWHCPVTLNQGPNTLRAYAVDSCGNCSRTNFVTVTYVVTQPLQLAVGSGGAVTGLTNGQPLEIGRAYAVTAKPTSGFVFAGWSSSAGTVDNYLNPAANFQMTTNLQLTARFVSNPFPSLANAFLGLATPVAWDGSGVSNAALVTVALSDKGLASGKLQIGARTIPFSGLIFDPVSFGGRLPIKVAGKPGLELALQFQQFTRGCALTGQLFSADNPVAVSQISARPAKVAANLAGAYTFVVPGATDGKSPSGDGAGAITIDKRGLANLTGFLADGKPLTMGSRLVYDPDADIYSVAVFQPLQSGQGVVIGWLDCICPAAGQVRIGAPAPGLYWRKAPAANDKYHTNGFSVVCQAVGASYSPPAAGKPVFSWTNGLMTVTGGNLEQALSLPALWKGNQLTISSTNSFTFKLNPSSGLFSGSFTHPQTRKVTPFRGALIRTTDEPGWGSGWFLGTNTSGRVSLQSQSPP